METIEIAMEARQEGRKRDARRLRREGKLPAVFYGRGLQAVPCQVDEKEFRSQVHGLDSSQLLKIKSEVAPLKDKVVLIKDVQHHPVTQKVLHLDFYEVDMSRKLTVMVPLHFVGRAAGVVQGGVLAPAVREIELECFPADIPEHLEVDVSPLEIGHGFKVGDISLPEGVVATTPEMALVSVFAPTVEEEPKEEELEAGAEGETPAADEGEAPSPDETKE